MSEPECLGWPTRPCRSCIGPLRRDDVVRACRSAPRRRGRTTPLCPGALPVPRSWFSVTPYPTDATTGCRRWQSGTRHRRADVRDTACTWLPAPRAPRRPPRRARDGLPPDRECVSTRAATSPHRSGRRGRSPTLPLRCHRAGAAAPFVWVCDRPGAGDPAIDDGETDRHQADHPVAADRTQPGDSCPLQCAGDPGLVHRSIIAAPIGATVRPAGTCCDLECQQLLRIVPKLAVSAPWRA